MMRVGSVLLAGLFFFLATDPLSGQEDDPSEIFLKAYLTTQQGEKLEHENRFKTALAKYRFAGSLIEQLRRSHADWQPAIVEFRGRKISEGILRLQERMARQNALSASASPLPEVAPSLPESEGWSEPGPEVVAPQSDETITQISRNAANEEAARKLRGKVDQLEDALAKLRSDLETAREKKDVVNARLKETASKLEKAQDEIEKSRKSEQQVRDQLAQVQDSLKALESSRDSGAKEQRQLRAEVARLKDPVAAAAEGARVTAEKQRDEAEAAFRNAAKLDPKFREAQYNLVQIPPPLHYAQAAWEFKHNNPEKAADWTASAKKIYSPALNSVFADAFYDVGWMQSPEVAAAPAPAFDTASVIAAQAADGPAVEPSPIPDTLLAANKQAEKSKDEAARSLALATNAPSTGTETTSPGEATEQSADAASNESVNAEKSAQLEGAPAAVRSEASVDVESTTTENSPAETTLPASSSAGQNEHPAAGETKLRGAPVVATTLGAPSTSRLDFVGVNRQTWLVGGLLLPGIFVLAWVVVPDLRRRYTFDTAVYRQIRMAKSPASEPGVASAETGVALRNGLCGSRQVSLRLTGPKPSLRHALLPSARSTGSFDASADLAAKEARAPAFHKEERDRELARELPPDAEPVFGSAVGPVIEQTARIFQPSAPQPPEAADAPAASKLNGRSKVTADDSALAIWRLLSKLNGPSDLTADEPIEIPGAAEEIALPAVAARTEPEIEPIGQEHPLPHEAAKIAKRAYELWQQRNCEHGEDLADWFQAERELVTAVQSPVADEAARPGPAIQTGISAEPEVP